METNFKLKKDSIMLKAAIVAVLSLLMLIPIHMVKSLIEERASTQSAVQDEISSKWGSEQSLTGPVLVLPYKAAASGQSVSNVYVLPDDFTVEGDIRHEERSRTLYPTLVYQSDLAVKGRFSIPDLTKLNVPADRVRWEDAYLLVGVTSLQGIKNKMKFKIDNTEYAVQPGVPANSIINSGVTVKMPVDGTNVPKGFDFAFDLVLNGTNQLNFSPIGKETHVHLKSQWKTVSFMGDFVTSARTVDDNGFDVRWDVFDYNRNYSQVWIGENPGLAHSTFGVTMKLPVDQYQMLLRSVKYAIMFIALTFVAFFLVEILGRKRIHPVQYLLVSFALVIFYTLLLAFSEHIGFETSYLISSLAVVALITTYSTSLFVRKIQSVYIALFLIILYIYLYVILQLEDMALLFGAVGLFVALAIIMFVSRKVNWYKMHTADNDADADQSTEQQVDAPIDNGSSIPTPPPYNQA